MEESRAGDAAAAPGGDDKLRRGLRALEEVGPAPGETLDEWARRIGANCGWEEWRSAPLVAELSRVTNLWTTRGYILLNAPPRVTVSHCRCVISGWRHVFCKVVLTSMPAGWLSSVDAFSIMYKTAQKGDRAYKESQDKSALCRLDASLMYSDAHRLAEECLELADTADSAAARYKWIQQWQYLCFALVGPRAQLLMVSQDYGHTTFRPAFGSGEQYSAPLFKHAAYCRQPACLSLHHRSKNDQSHAPLNLIPARVTPLCPLFATGLLRLYQHGKEFANLAPPGWRDDTQAKVVWPALASAVNKPWESVDSLYSEPLRDVAKELGMSVEGGVVKALRQLNVMHTSANPDCSDADGARIAEHNREGRRDQNYYTMHGRPTQLIAHYLGDDPTQAASLCALTQLLTEHDDEMTELVLSGLSKPYCDAFRAFQVAGKDSSFKSVTHFFETSMYLMKVAVVMSRVRIYSAELMIAEDSPTPADAYKLVGSIMDLSFGGHSFLKTIDERLAHYETQEIRLGDTVLIPASHRFANDKLLKASLRGVEKLLDKQGRILLSGDDAEKIQAAWESNQLSDLERSDIVSRAKGIDERAARALLGMATPISESLRTGARLYRTPRELDASERDCEAERVADACNEEAVELCVRELKARGEWSDDDAACAFSLPQRRRGDKSVVRPKRLRISPSESSPPPQPSPEFALVTSAAPSDASSSVTSSALAQPNSSSAPLVTTQAYIDCKFSFLTTDGTLGEIVGRFVHGWLPLDFSGCKPKPKGISDDNRRQRLCYQRDILFKSLTLTIADGETVPRPHLLRHVLHNTQSVARKAQWAKDVNKQLRAEMLRYVYGVSNAKETFKYDPTVLQALQAGIDASGATSPDPALAPAAPVALAPPPTQPAQRRFVALDPGITDSRYGVAVATVVSNVITRVQQTSFKPRAATDKSRQDVRVGSAVEMLVPILSGAEEVFVEPYRYAAGTSSGADTSYYMRAAAHAAAYQAGAGRTSEVNLSSWKETFPRKGESLHESFSIPPPACKDATDAVCILLHQLVRQRGFSLAAGEYEVM